MGYLFLIISLACGVTKGYCGKKTSGYVNGYIGSTMVSIVRLLLCVIIGFTLVIAGGNLQYLRLDTQVLWICLLSGVSTAVFLVSWMVSVKKSAYMMLDVFLLLGMLVPLILSWLLFNEKVTLTHWLGLIILFAAVLLMCSYNNSIKEKITFKSLAILVLCGLASGFSDFSQKLFVKQLPDTPISIFKFYAYVFAVAILVVFYFMRSATVRSENREKPALSKFYGYIIIMAISLFGNSYFKTAAAGYLDAAQLYPLSHGCALILSTAMSSLFFGEKPSRKSIIGLILTFIALIIIQH